MAPSRNWPRSFEAAAGHQRFIGAADDLDVSQAAVSRQGRPPEGHAGKKLSNRLPGQASLTEAGRRLNVNFAGRLAPLERKFANDLNSSASLVGGRCNTGIP
ncbi:MAG: LysR family transcriptional regulator [Boseongicola sp. SB0662_bin_57]|nr:LysR family transcriptional regulator [Boseongicola sp. SB0662_bin_57]